VLRKCQPTLEAYFFSAAPCAFVWSELCNKRQSTLWWKLYYCSCAAGIMWCLRWLCLMALCYQHIMSCIQLV